MGSEVVQIKILGTTFSIRSDQDPEYVQQLLEYLNTKIDEIQKNTAPTDSMRTAILASLLITDELFKEREKAGSSAAETDASREASRLTAEIIQKLEKSLEEE